MDVGDIDVKASFGVVVGQKAGVFEFPAKD